MTGPERELPLAEGNAGDRPTRRDEEFGRIHAVSTHRSLPPPVGQRPRTVAKPARGARQSDTSRCSRRGAVLGRARNLWLVRPLRTGPHDYSDRGGKADASFVIQLPMPAGSRERCRCEAWFPMLRGKMEGGEQKR